MAISRSWIRSTGTARRAVLALGAFIGRLPRWLKVVVLGFTLAGVGLGSAMRAAAPLTVTVEQTGSHRYFSPDGDGQNDVVTVLLLPLGGVQRHDRGQRCGRPSGPYRGERCVPSRGTVLLEQPGRVGRSERRRSRGGRRRLHGADPRGGRGRSVRPGRGAGRHRHPHAGRADLPAPRRRGVGHAELDVHPDHGLRPELGLPVLRRCAPRPVLRRRGRHVYRLG